MSFNSCDQPVRHLLPESLEDTDARTWVPSFKDPNGGVAVVFRKEPLRLTLQERVCLLLKVALECCPANCLSAWATS